MRLPIEVLVALLLAEFLQGPAFRRPVSGWVIGGGLAAMVVACWLLPRLTWAVLRRRLAGGLEQLLPVHELHAKWLTGARCFSVALYALFLWATGWSALVVAEDGLDAGATVIGDDILQILPFVLASAALWAGDYPAMRGLRPADWSLGEYLRHQVRGWGLLLAPWLIMTAVFDSRHYWPWGLDKLFTEQVPAELALTALIFAAAMLFFPLYLVRLWPPRRLPDGELRSRLEALLVRAGVRCREMMVWSTGRGRLPNAAVIGVIAPLRYVAFTDALLAELAPEEIEAVLAHEAGHVQHHHIGFYAFYAAAFMGLGLGVVVLLPESMTRKDAPAEGQAMAAAVLVAFTVFYWRYVFGFLSRRFERQADAAACELLGDSAPLASALEKLAAVAGAPRAASSWRHYSIAERVDFLRRAAADPTVIPGHHRHVRRVKLVSTLVALAALAAVAAGIAGRRAPGDPPEVAPPVARPTAPG